MNSLDIPAIRKQFPLLARQLNGNPYIYLDNCATTQKPQSVINALNAYYTEINSNIHRGVHSLSQWGTEAFEDTRTKVQHFIHAQYSQEIIFTKGATESINLVAWSLGEAFIHKGDEILVSMMEHHANIVPWQLLCQRKGAVLKVIPITEEGELDLQAYHSLLSDKTKLVAVAHVSNVLGTINPIKELIQSAHLKGAMVLIDGAQALSHLNVNVQELDCDFYVFSAHKMYAPMGVGVLYGKEEYLNAMPPYQGGGEMIKEVSFNGTTFNELPFKFEAGTPSVGDVLAFGKAIDFIQELGIQQMASYENSLYQRAMDGLSKIPNIHFFGRSPKKAAVLSFNIEGIHPYDIGMILDKLGIAVRTGHHCAQPLMEFFKIPGTVRACFAIYNTEEEVDAFIAGVQKAKEMLA